MPPASLYFIKLVFNIFDGVENKRTQDLIAMKPVIKHDLLWVIIAFLNPINNAFGFNRYEY